MTEAPPSAAPEPQSLRAPGKPPGHTKAAAAAAPFSQAELQSETKVDLSEVAAEPISSGAYFVLCMVSSRSLAVDFALAKS